MEKTPWEKTPWVLLDTQTTGLNAPIFVIEIGAQRMCGWQPEGSPFRRLLNQNAEIPPEASWSHGYTREILERDGEEPRNVYRDFADYAAGLPLVSFNLAYDLDEVLLPEWLRLGIPFIGQRGFCALRLAQRLLDPLPVGNCKLQTLRQFFRLPECRPNTALGDVETVLDLLGQILRPLAEQRGLDSWEAVVEFAEALWFPSRIAFGKHKGRDFRDARTDADLLGWLEWLADSSNTRSMAMGQWYLNRLDSPEYDQSIIAAPDFREGMRRTDEVRSSGIVVFVDAEAEELKRMIAAARYRLADLEAEYTKERHTVDFTQARLFDLLQGLYQRRDRLRLIVSYRRLYLDTLLQAGEEEAEEIVARYESARAHSDSKYEQAAAEISDQRELSPEEAAELQTLWRKLVRLFHPDRFVHSREKRITYEWLTSEINRARDRGDIDCLRKIANDPNSYMLGQGLESLDFQDSPEVKHLRRLLETLQRRIVDTLDALNTLREDPRYELHVRVTQQPGLLAEVAAEHAQIIKNEIAELAEQATILGEEIEMLTGTVVPGNTI